MEVVVGALDAWHVWIARNEVNKLIVVNFEFLQLAIFIGKLLFEVRDLQCLLLDHSLFRSEELNVHPGGWSKEHRALCIPPSVCLPAVVNDPDLSGRHRACNACLGLLQSNFLLLLEADTEGFGTNPVMEVVPVAVEDVGTCYLTLRLRSVNEGLQLLPGGELGLLDFVGLLSVAELASDHPTTSVVHDVLEVVLPTISRLGDLIRHFYYNVQFNNYCRTTLFPSNFSGLRAFGLSSSVPSISNLFRSDLETQSETYRSVTDLIPIWSSCDVAVS